MGEITVGIPVRTKYDKYYIGLVEAIKVYPDRDREGRHVGDVSMCHVRIHNILIRIKSSFLEPLD